MPDTRRTNLRSTRNGCRAAARSRATVTAPRTVGLERIEAARRAFHEQAGRIDPRGRRAIVIQTLDPMTVHAALEEELLFPAHGCTAAAHSVVVTIAPGDVARPAAAPRLRRGGRPRRRDSARLIDLFL